jgi:glycerophosphoryl diester phosphodiesterase
MTPRAPRIVAHRGRGFGRRENTAAAFAAVRAHGGFGVELDVRLTRDLVPVIHHDREVMLEGRAIPIDRLARAALPGYLPTLHEALAALGGSLPIDLEVKPTRRSIRPALDALRGRRVRLSSFSAAVLAEARELAPELPRALLIEEGDDARAAIPKARALGAEGMHVHVSHLDALGVGAMREAGLAVRAYTLNAPAEWRLAFALGIDAIMTDRPRALAAWLSRAPSRAR